MKIIFDADEWWPVYSLKQEDAQSFPSDVEMDLSEDEVAEFKEAYRVFSYWQDRIREEGK